MNFKEFKITTSDDCEPGTLYLIPTVFRCKAKDDTGECGGWATVELEGEVYCKNGHWTKLEEYKDQFGVIKDVKLPPSE